MASIEGVTTALKLLAVNFAGTLTPEKAELWRAALGDVTDEQLAFAVPRVIREHTGDFIPPVAVVRAACHANDRPALDVDTILARIDALGEYNPNGWILPRQSLVRDAMGEVIAAVLAEVGGSRLFGDDPTTRDIARQEFARALKALAGAHSATALPSWAVVSRIAPVFPRQLPAGEPDPTTR